MRDATESLESLLSACALGDASAFERLYSSTSSQLFGAALRIVGDRQSAEDITQEAYLQIWRSAGRFAERKGSAKAWMLSILRYRAIDLRRKKLRTDLRSDPVDENQADDGPGPEVQAMQGQDRVALHRCMEELSEDQGRTIRMAYSQGLTQQEVAEALNAPLGTVKSWIRRGLLALQECLSR